MIEHFKYCVKMQHPEHDADFHIWNLPRTSLHDHDYFEVFLITKGPADYLINGDKITLEKNTLSFVRPHDVHQFANPSTKQQQHVNIAVKPDTVKDICGIIKPSLYERLMRNKRHVTVKLSNDDFNILLYFINRVNLVDSGDYVHYLEEIKILLFNAISFFNNNYFTYDSVYPKWFDDLLIKINSPSFIENSVSDMYSVCNYSPPIIINAFKKHLGVTPIKYLTNLKINHACNLLKNTDFTTLYISGSIGYDSLRHFNEVFKASTGMTPKQYRQNSAKSRED